MMTRVRYCEDEEVVGWLVFESKMCLWGESSVSRFIYPESGRGRMRLPSESGKPLTISAKSGKE